MKVQEWGCFSIFRRADDVTLDNVQGLKGGRRPRPACVGIIVYTAPPVT